MTNGPLNYLMGLPGELKMDSDSVFCGGYKATRVLGTLTPNSFTATSGEVEPEHSDASPF